jgi:ABC-2 type transport system ATP-binding protein
MDSLLDVRRLSKAYGGVRAVDEVSFRVEPGEVYGLLGPNGAGKTTTISMVCGLLRPDAGEVVVDGVGFASDPNRARRLLGVVPQELALYEELSGRENLEFWGRLGGLTSADARVRAGELLEGLGLVERGKDPVKAYSGGMKRRINLGAGLMHRPRLLLLDEPTVGIDPQARASVLGFIRGLAASGTGILYTTHYLEEAEMFCRRLGIIDQGRLLAEGTLDELRARVGGDRVYVVEGALGGVDPAAWPGFADRFRILQRSDRQWVAAGLGERSPTECLAELLALPVAVENVSLKRPSLNEVFLQLTGRELRE